MLKNTTSAQTISIVNFHTSIPSDGITHEDEHRFIEIRPAGLNLTTEIAEYLVKNNEAVICDMIGDYEHTCWCLRIKWKNLFFELWIYKFEEVLLRVKGPYKKAPYQELIDILDSYLEQSGHASNIKWSGEHPNKRYLKPTKIQVRE